MQILTPAGYKDISTVSIGDEVSAFDINTGNPIINIIEEIEFITTTTEGLPAPFDPTFFFQINGGDIFYGEQSIWANDNVTHIKNLQIGDILYDDHNNPFAITALVQVSMSGWWRFQISGDASYIVDDITLHNASRFLITGGSTVSWTTINTAIWSATTGGATGASVPGSSDTVTMDANSGGGTVQPNYAFTVISITMGAYTNGTLDFSSSNNSPSMSTFSCSGTSTRTLNMGSGTFSITGNNATVWTFATGTGLTFNAGTSTVQFTYSGSTGTRTINAGSTSQIFYNFSITAGSDTVSQTPGFACSNNYSTVGFTGTLSKTAQSWNIGGNFTLGTGSTITGTGGTLTLNGTGTVTITTNGVSLTTFGLTLAGVGGTFNLGSALTITGAVAFTLTNGAFNSQNFAMNIMSLSSSNSNTRSFTLGTSVVVCAGNWNFSTITGLTTSMASSTITLSGTNLSFTGGSQAYGTVNVTGGGASILGSASNTYVTFNYTGVGTGDSLTLNQNQTVSGILTITGNSGVNTVNVISNLAGTLKVWTFGSASFTDCTWSDISLTENASGGTWTLNEALNLTSATVQPIITITQGTFTTNNFNITAGIFALTGATTKVINLGSSIISLYGTTANTLALITSGTTFNAGTSTFEFTDTSNANIGMTGAALTLYNVYFHRGSSTGSITWNGNTTFNQLQDDGTASHSIIITATQIITINGINGWKISGTAGNLITLTSTTTVAFTVVNGSGANFSADYLNIQHMISTPVSPAVSTFYAGRNSVNNQNVASNGSGIAFCAPGDTNGNYLGFS